MWGIGIRRTYDVNADYISVKDSIYNEDSLVKKFLMIFGMSFQIWEKKFNSNNKIRKNQGEVGFK